jgi:hypothetical protein
LWDQATKKYVVDPGRSEFELSTPSADGGIQIDASVVIRVHRERQHAKPESVDHSALTAW